MLTIMIGGAGSGKSAFAENYVCALPGRKIYLATMLPRDAESRERVSKHRAQRAHLGFETLERGLDLAGADIPADANVLLEDLSNLLANEMYEPDGDGMDSVRRGLDHLITSCDHLTVVTNEVFSGGADYDPESLRYMRALSDLNRWLAARADLAVEVVCGLPNVLKGELA
jgi:adenosylcobinamide kinase/adenosylcobinamide-phosphate guanylyltransferase